MPRAIHVAFCGEGGGRGAVEGGFPEVGEFGEDVGRGGVGGAVVHEGDEALVGRDELVEGRPGGEGEEGGYGAVDEGGRGGVGVGFEAADGEGEIEGCHVEGVVRGQEQRDDLLRVFVQPFPDGLEVV